MPVRSPVFALVAFMLAAIALPSLGHAAVDVTRPSSAPIGKHIEYLIEEHDPLSLNQAIARHDKGAFLPGQDDILNFHIGSQPVWLRFDVDNGTDAALDRILAIETSWLDRLDISILHRDRRAATHVVGDALPFAARATDHRFFNISHPFPPGTSTVFIRVDTPDPKALPIYLRDPKTAQAVETTRVYSYGFIYGGVFGLLAYNALLFFSLRQARYILYSLFLSTFLLLNMSYTGHGYAWLWASSVKIQMWGNPTLMQLYVYAGLAFATSFLDTRNTLPRFHRALVMACTALITLAILLFAFDQYLVYLLLAFVVILAFSAIMLSLGILSVRAGYKPARYFLAASFIASTGMAMTASAVWGFIPFNAWTFRTVEFGVLADAVLLALALAYQYRLEHDEKMRALQLARVDPLTRINNRRAFYTIAKPLWSTAERNGRDVSLILLDVDHFKTVNDTHGHGHGDTVLVALAQILTKSAREGDISARWGGEEFILYLPETDIDAAIIFAERLRQTIEQSSVAHVTISAGVAQKQDRHRSLEDLIGDADIQLYQAKKAGRNRVSAETP